MPRSLANKHSEEIIRFFLVSLVGLGIDIGIAWALISLSGTSDTTAAVSGFSVATVINYFGHHRWTFRNNKQQVSFQQFMAFVGVVIVTLSVRLQTLSFLGPLLPGSGLAAPTRLGLAAIASFLVSFFLSKLLVFKQQKKSHAR